MMPTKNNWRLGMNYVKIPEATHSDFLPTEIPVYDSKDIQWRFARYYHHKDIVLSCSGL
jgi:hypothetical protein